MRTIVALGVVLFLGCGLPKPGESCERTGESVCDGSAKMLHCDGKKWNAIICDGPGGCSTTGTRVECSFIQPAPPPPPPPQVGDACEPANSARCKDADEIFVCQGSPLRLAEFRCHGSTGCTSSSAGTACDWTGAQPAEACPAIGEGFFTCNGAFVMKCQGGAWTPTQCPSGQSCVEGGGQVRCA